jgi:hypothetical protein
MQPLLDVGLVDEEEQEALHRWDAEWAPVPNGLSAGIAWNPTLISFVSTLIAGTPLDGETFLSYRDTADPRLRVFSLRKNEAVHPRGRADRAHAAAEASWALLRERLAAIDEYSYIRFRALASRSVEQLNEEQLRERLEAIGHLLRVRLQARTIVSEALAAHEHHAASALSALDPIWREVVPDASVIVTDPDGLSS